MKSFSIENRWRVLWLGKKKKEKEKKKKFILEASDHGELFNRVITPPFNWQASSEVDDERWMTELFHANRNFFFPPVGNSIVNINSLKLTIGVSQLAFLPRRFAVVFKTTWLGYFNSIRGKILLIYNLARDKTYINTSIYVRILFWGQIWTKSYIIHFDSSFSLLAPKQLQKKIKKEQ